MSKDITNEVLHDSIKSLDKKLTTLQEDVTAIKIARAEDKGVKKGITLAYGAIGGIGSSGLIAYLLKFFNGGTPH